MRSAHSPFGTVWSIAAATGWKIRYILWQVSFASLQIMIADAPRYVSGNRRGGKIESEEELIKFLK
ncbi:hypothetical protein AGMMS4956_14140 [Bacteroidia bacterium]|nr:hypothetical protein AGMMS4956_14140 [Bacteroidia bacterium]